MSYMNDPCRSDRNGEPDDEETVYEFLLIHRAAREDLLDRLRSECSWPNPDARRDKLDMDFNRPAPLTWQVVHPLVRELANELGGRLGADFNRCVVHWYRTGEIGNDWHSDAEACDDETPVVIVSLGAERPFWTREIGSEIVTQTYLPHRSAFVMPRGFQVAHEHRLPAMDASVGERIALVFSRRKA